MMSYDPVREYGSNSSAVRDGEKLETGRCDTPSVVCLASISIVISYARAQCCDDCWERFCSEFC